MHHLVQRRHDVVAPRLHARGGDLHGQIVAVTVHHQAGNPVGLAEQQPVAARGVAPLAQSQRHLDAMHQQRLVEKVILLAAHHPRADQGGGIHVGPGQPLLVVAHHRHLLAGPKGLQGRTLRVHLVAVDPEVAGTQAALVPLCQEEYGDFHGALLSPITPPFSGL